MKKINILLVFLIHFSTVALSQSDFISGKIIDESGDGIPYATIGILEKNFGIAAFEDGSFKIKIREHFLEDTLVISALGYEKKKILFNEFVNSKSYEFTLKEDLLLLDEFVVQPTNLEYSRIGVLKKQSNSNFTLTYPLRGSSIAAKFNEKSESLLLKEISVVVGKLNMDVTQLRCRIFSVHPKTGLPYKNLLKENLIIDSRKKTETLTFKLEEDFWVNEPIFIGFEWITTKSQFKRLQETLKAYPTDFLGEIVRANPGYITNLYEDKKLQFRDSTLKLIKEVKLTKEQTKLLKSKNKVSPVFKFKILNKGTNHQMYSGSSITGRWSLTPHEALISVLVGKQPIGSDKIINSEIQTKKTVLKEDVNGITTITDHELIGFNKIDAFIERKMDSLDIPGASIAIINNGRVVYHSVKGFAEKGKNNKVNNETIFEGASISKSMFAYFVMGFVEKGILDLDKPLHQYMEYPDIAYDERYKKITARMVLCHRSGFPNWRTDTPGNKLFLLFEPGTSYSYSGEGYQYLAKVLAHILNTDDVGLEALFQKNVAKPLGMKHTRFIQDSYNMRHKAQPYVDGVWHKRIDMGPVFGAAFSIHSEALDYSRWVINGLIKERGLSQESFHELFREQTEIPNSTENSTFNKYNIDTYGLGFSRAETEFGTAYGHGGNNFGFTSLFYFLKEEKWGIVVFTNSEYATEFGVELAAYAATGDPEYFN